MFNLILIPFYIFDLIYSILSLANVHKENDVLKVFIIVLWITFILTCFLINLFLAFKYLWSVL
jgi:hypothetical protein